MYENAKRERRFDPKKQKLKWKTTFLGLESGTKPLRDFATTFLSKSYLDSKKNSPKTVPESQRYASSKFSQFLSCCLFTVSISLLPLHAFLLPSFCVLYLLIKTRAFYFCIFHIRKSFICRTVLLHLICNTIHVSLQRNHPKSPSINRAQPCRNRTSKGSPQILAQ